MKGSTGQSMNGSIEYTRASKKKLPKKNCKTCKNFSSGYCTKHGFRPTTVDLGTKCKDFTKKRF